MRVCSHEGHCPAELPIVLGAAAAHRRERMAVAVAEAMTVRLQERRRVALEGCRRGRARSFPRVEGDGELVDQGVDQRRGVLGGRLRQARVDQRGVDRAVTELTLDVLKAQTALEQVGGVGVAEGVRGNARADAGIAGNELDRALHAALAHRAARAQALLGGVPGGEQQPGVTVGSPVAAERNERQLGQDHVAIFLALAESDVDPMLLGVDVLGPRARGPRSIEGPCCRRRERRPDSGARERR